MNYICSKCGEKDEKQRKSYQPKRSKREDFKIYDDYNLDCGCHAETGIFSRYFKCNLNHEIYIP